MTENIFDQHPEDEQAQQNTTSIFDSHPQEDDTAPYAPPGSIEEKQRKVEMGIAELRAKNMDTQRAQKAFRISQDEGLPMEVAYRQADKFIQSRKPGEIAAIAPDAPASARHLSKGDNLSVYTPEDVQKLGTWEKLQRQWEKTGRESEEGIELSDIGFKMMNGSATKQDEARYYEIKQLQRSRADFEDDGWVPFIMSAAHSAVDYTVTAAERSLAAGAQGAAGGAAAAVVAGQLGPQAALPEEIATVPAGAAFGATTAFSLEMMRQTYQLISGQAFLAAKETLDADGNPLDDDTAKAVGITTGLVSALFEVVTLGAASKIVSPTLTRLVSRNGVKEFVDKVQKNPALKSSVTKVATNIARGAGAEGLQEVAEQTTQIVSILVGGGTFDEDGNRVDEQLSLENTLLTFLGGAAGGAFMSGGLQAGAKGVDIGVQFTRNRIQARRDALVAQGDALRGISATKGAPGALADFASELEADSPSQASAPAEALTKLFQDAGLSDNDVAQQFPELKQALDDAANTGVEVPIPHQTMIKLQMLEKEAFDEFSQDVRTDPKLQTAREAAAEGQQDQAALEEEISKMTEEQKVAAIEASLIEEATQQIVAATDQSAATARAQAKLRVRGQITMMRNAGYSIEDIAQLTRVSVAGPNKYAVEVKGQETAGPDAMQQPDVTQTPAFRQWFGDSKVVDTNGQPMVVYHGTGADIEAFDFGRLGSESYGRTATLGTFFTASPEVARPFTYTSGGQPNIVPAYVSLQNPLVMEAMDFWQKLERRWGPEEGRDKMTQIRQRLMNAGYDGIIVNPDPFEAQRGGEFAATTVIAFSPNQIKSVFNRGTFDRSSDNILFQSGGDLFDNPLPIEGKKTVKAIGEALTADHMEKHGRQFFPEDSEADFNEVLGFAKQEMAAQLARPNSGVGWYSKDVALALRETEKLLPGVSTPEGRAAFLTFAGIFSNGLDPSQAWEMSAEAWAAYQATGVIPVKRGDAARMVGREPTMTTFKDNKTGKQVTREAGWGIRNQANEQQLQLFKTLVEREGSAEAAVKWLLTPQKREDINQLMADGGMKTPRYKTAAERNGPDAPGVMMFGEKLGRYTMGLHGVEVGAEDTTVDLWYTRTYRRWTGRLMEKPIGKEGIAAQPDPARGGIERQTIFRLTDALSKEFNLSAGDVQAVLWFYEKRLWGTQGLRTDEGTNSAGARRLLEKAGLSFDDGAGSDVASSAPQGRPARDGSGRSESGSLAPLPGAPTVQGATGPDPSLVSVAEAYAREAGINLARQAEFVKADPERGARIAAAYDAMPHAPQDPAVQEAYQNLIAQTMAQYQALERAGYTFTFFDDATDPYEGNPWNAMRDLRANKTMAVYGTYSGYGTEGVTGAAVDDNPMLADTGLQWPDQSGVMRPVTANDLFRAVRDAFGHGLEGAGFRADGEENAWQAHVRLFTGSAVAAITTETRGQNSWLNFGPYGEANRTASVEDTVFAEQKTGLMPEWTWTEGRAADEVTRLNQDIQPVFYSAMLRGVEGAKQPKAPAAQWMGILKNMPGVKQEELDWLGVEDWLKSQDGSVTKEQLVEYIRANQVNVEEVVLGEADPVVEGRMKEIEQERLGLRQRLDPDVLSELPQEELMQIALQVFPSINQTVAMQPDQRDTIQIAAQTALEQQIKALNEEYSSLQNSLNAPRHEHHYRLPGGENYREIVLTMPGQIEPYVPDQMHFTSEGGGTAIGWARIDDRTGPNGERILHVDEIQTKRHQDALKKGYRKKNETGKIVLQNKGFKVYEVRNANSGLRGQSFDTREEAQAAIEGIYSSVPNLVIEEVTHGQMWKVEYPDGQFFGGYGSREQAEEARANLDKTRTGGGVPDAPFKTTWDELVLKRVLRYAIDNGYDSITWPSGEIVADRYNMRNQIEEVEWNPKTARLYVRPVGRASGDFDKVADNVTEANLADYIGQDAAAKLIAAEPQGDLKNISVDDISVGGDFLLNLYNKRIPRFLSKLTKKMGGEVGATTVETEGAYTTEMREWERQLDRLNDRLYRLRENKLIALEQASEAGEDMEPINQTYEVMIADTAAEIADLEANKPAEKETAEVWTLPITDEMRAAVPQGLPLFQTGDSPRGFIEFTKARDIFTITLTGNANLSTYLHESGHYFLELMTDLVESGQASVRMAEDLQKLREWAGVGPDGKFQVEHHEKFARAFEAYLMEGNAPSRDLRGIFNKFKGWLTFIYKSLTNLNVELTDEVRGVMDRMLATDEEIAKAKRQSGRSEQPEAQENLGMTDQEYGQYIRLWEASQEAEKVRVDMRKMKDYLIAHREAFKDEVARVTRQMREQIEETQAYQTWDDLRNRQVKIDRDSIPAELREMAFGMWSKDGSGLPLDVMAESKGYQNGKEMLTDIAAMRARLDAIPEEARKSVEEAHGFVTDAEIEKVSQQAIQQKEHEELMLMEYMSLTARDGKRARKGFMEWMHQTAANRVSLMTDRELKPDHWRRAELKAAQKVGAAIASGDTTAAALAKRQQIMAYTMHKATLEAVDGIAKIRNDMMKFSKKSRQATLGKAGEVFQNGVNALLEQVSFRAATLRSIDAAKAVQKMMDEFGPNSIAQIPDNVAALLGKTHYRDMTYGDLVALHETVTTIYRQARDQNKLKAAERELSFQEWLKEVRDRAMANMGAVPQSARSGRNLKENAVEGLRYSRAQMVKQEFLTAMFDGSISSGPAKEILFDPIADAEAAEWELKKKIYKPIIDRFRSMSKAQRRRLNEKVDFMGNGWNMGKQGTRMNVLMAAMNMGNASSMDKLLGGYGWDEQRLRNEVNSLLSKEDFDLMQDILDTVNKLWPDVERESFKATGIKPEKIEAMAIETPYGTYAGGYFPVAYDLGHIDNKISQSKITEDGTFVNNFFSAKVQDGMTKKRTGVVSPVRLEPDVLTNHLRETIHYITHFEAVSQIDRVLRRPEFRRLVFEVAGEEFYKEMRRWLKDVAQGAYVSDSSMQGGEKWLHHLRTGTSLAFLGFGIGTMAKQQLGLFTSLRAVKPMYWASGIARVYNPITGPGVIRRAFKESTELQRLIDEWDRDFGKEIDRIGSKLDSTLWDKIRVYAMRGIALSQALVNVATYVAAKDQRLNAGDTPAEAKRYAEAAIRMTQSAAGMKDMSPVQRANEATKMITPFFSFASVFYNQLELIKQEHKSFKDTPKTFGKLLVMVIAPAVATVLIDELLSSLSDEEDDDDKTLAQKMALETLSYSLMGLPVIRDIMSFTYRPSISPYGQAYEQFQATPKAAAELMTEGEIRRSTAKQAVTGISVITKVPLHQPYGYLDDFFGERIFEK